MLLARRNYLSAQGESHAEIDESEKELNGDEAEHPELYGEPINGDNAEPEEPEDDQPPPLEEMEQVTVDEAEKEDQGRSSS